ncbi:MAG: hypothetical protein HY690_03815 [Chloroflexi bacterium]|nr:hypothetical protein [Chloroflexota bacterium]
MPGRNVVLSVLGAVAVLAVACAPAAPPSPTAAPAKPAPTAAPAKQEAKPAATPAPAKPAATAAPAAKPGAFDEKAVADFYKGKTIRIIIGFAPGGGFDTISRVIAKVLPKYVPGNPNVIAENREGAGSMLAANAVFKSEPKDGTAIGSFNENLVLLQALGQQGIEYDASKFQWLASMVNSPSACATRVDAGINSIDEVIAGKQWIVGAEAPGTTTHDVPSVLKGALGANIKLVAGYTGTSKQRLAVENKEVDGICFTWESMRTTARAWFEQSPPSARVLIIMGGKTPDHPWLKGVPAAETLAKTPEARQLLVAVNAPSEMSKPYAVAPEVPKERVQALRQAFAQVAADKDFQAEIEKAKLEVTYSAGPEVEARVKQVLDTPPAVADKLKTMLK